MSNCWKDLNTFCTKHQNIVCPIVGIILLVNITVIVYCSILVSNKQSFDEGKHRVEKLRNRKENCTA